MEIKSIITFAAVALMLAGCSGQSQEGSAAGPQSSQEKKAVVINAEQAISLAENFETVKEKKDYLIARAEEFYKSEEFQQAVETAQHILLVLDKDSVKAKQLLEDAKKKLEAEAQAKVADVKNALGGLGN